MAWVRSERSAPCEGRVTDRRDFGELIVTLSVAYPPYAADAWLVARKSDRDRSFATQGFALPAGLGAEPAMLMVLAMFIAFLGAKLARLGAGFDHPPDDLVVAAGAA